VEAGRCKESKLLCCITGGDFHFFFFTEGKEGKKVCLDRINSGAERDVVSLLLSCHV
jgi:hypothetical protein